jgi:hypothetical protein
MTKYLLRKNLQVGSIIRPSNNHIFYKVTAKFGWLIKAERYYPNRKPQGREHYGYEKLPVSTLRHGTVLW